MKIVFIGSSQFGLNCLKTIQQIPKLEITGIITNPAQFSISYRPSGVSNVLHADFARYAKENNLPCYLMSSDEKMNNPSLLEQLNAWQPNLIVVIGWYHMIPEKIRKMALTIGMHASLLPKYSGGAPLVWAIIQGEKKTGITLFELADGVDNGPIFGQSEVPILYEDTIASLYAKIETAGQALLCSLLPQIMDGQVQKQVQDERQRQVMPQRSPEDGRINWNASAESIYNFIRAQTHPYPGAFSIYNQQRLSIWAALPTPQIGAPENAQPGQIIIQSDKTLAVVCKEYQVIQLISWEYPDKTRLYTHKNIILA